MRRKLRRSVVISAVVGIASILYGVAALIPLIESSRLGVTGERIAGVLLILAGLFFVGLAVWTALYARRIGNDSGEG